MVRTRLAGDAGRRRNGEAEMEQSAFTVRDVPTIGPGVRRFVLECLHGRTAGLVLPGRKPVADLIVLDLLRVRHNREQGCRCTTVLRPATSQEGSAAAPAQVFGASRPLTASTPKGGDA